MNGLCSCKRLQACLTRQLVYADRSLDVSIRCLSRLSTTVYYAKRGAGTSLTRIESGIATRPKRTSTSQTKCPPSTCRSMEKAKSELTNVGAIPRATAEHVCWSPNMLPSWSGESTEVLTIIMLSLLEYERAEEKNQTRKKRTSQRLSRKGTIRVMRESKTVSSREHIHSNPYRNQDQDNSSPLHCVFLGLATAHRPSCSKIAYRHEQKSYGPERGEERIQATIIESPLDVGE
jgi:hypothetical protein